MYTIEDAFHIENEAVKLITIKNKNQIEVQLLNYGAAIVAIYAPDKNGTIENIVLTYKNMEDYIENPSYFGVTVGRTAGRIANGTFKIDEKQYFLNKNFDSNHGHGGIKGFSYQIWNYSVQEEIEQTSVEFSYSSKHIEENYPGNLDVKVTYILTDYNELIIRYEAITDKKTICNLTNHSYFNLSGNDKRKVTDQYLKISSKQFLELDDNQIPTGKFIDVQNTPMDFNKPKLIGRDIETDYEQIKKTNGYDHPWMLNKTDNQIELIDKVSGRKMSVTTSYPCAVVYSYNFSNNEKLQNGKIGSQYDGICFETQYEPDGINHKHLNSAILDVNEKYDEQTIFKFSITLEE